MLTQLPYVIGYLIVFYHWDHADLEEALSQTFRPPVTVTLPAIRFMSLIGFAIRVYFLSLVWWKHYFAAHRFSQVFPALLALDGLWAATPLLVSHRISSAVSWTGVVLLAWLMFGQRTAMLSLRPGTPAPPTSITTIHGTVEARDGGIPKFEVEFTPTRVGAATHAVTVLGGEFSIPLPAGEYRVTIAGLPKGYAVASVTAGPLDLSEPFLVTDKGIADRVTGAPILVRSAGAAAVSAGITVRLRKDR
jgi:hypothetical protein